MRKPDGELFIPAQTRRERSADFLFMSSLPSWLSLVSSGSVTTTFNDPSSSRGELQLDIANTDGGLQAPGVDLTQVKALRLSVGFRASMNTGNPLTVGFVNSSTSVETSEIVRIGQFSSDGLETTVKTGASSEAEQIGPNPTGGKQFDYSITLIPSETALSVDGPNGSNFYYEEGSNYDPTLTFYPTVGIVSSLEGTTDTIYLSKFKVEVWQ
jgi:hypothetical protein